MFGLLEKTQSVIDELDRDIQEEIKLHESNDGVFIETPKYIKLLKIKKQLLDCVEEMHQLQLQYGYEDEIMSVGSWLLWGLAIIAFIAICILV